MSDILKRFATIFVAALLVGSIFAPIAATAPAAAQGGDSIEINEDCGATAKLAFPRSCHAAEAVFGSCLLYTSLMARGRR
ncbi:hypothetical protein, partial [Natrinema altunense]